MVQDSERHNLVENMPDAFAYHRIILNDQGNPIDYVFLDVNAAFKKMTGLKREKIIGEKFTEALPGIQDSAFDWIGTFGRVAITGESTSFDGYSEPLSRWYKVSAYSDKPGYFVTVFKDITESKVAEEALQKSEENLSITLQSIGDGVIATDTRGRITRMNLQAEKLTGWAFQEAQGRWITEVFNIISGQTGEAAINPVHCVMKTGEIESMANDTILIARDGTRLQIADSAAPIRDSEGTVTGIVMVFSDVTEKYKAWEELRESRNLMRGVFESIQEGISVLNSDLTIRQTNSTMKKWYNQEEPLEGKKCFKVYQNREEPCDPCPALRCLQSGSMEREEFRVETALGEKWVEVFSYPLFESDTNKITGTVEFLRDITERKESEEKIRYMSFHDSLTELYNRAYLEQEMQRLGTKRQLPISIIMADLNGLKMVNDTYGHSVGDELLISAAEILKRACREEDIISRWSGDEFVIFLPQTTILEAQLICKRIVHECSKIQVKTVPLSMALGTASKISMEENLKGILKEAEDNMYKNKLAESRSTKSAVLNALLKTLEEKSFETEGHARRMQETAMKIGNKINLPETELDRLTLLVYLHDIGKITVPEEILTKKERLTEKDWEYIKTHPESGYRIARSMEEFAHVAEDILCHHEHWNGLGYPKRLKGKEIPILARILAIVDAYEVMINGRPYKEPLHKNEVAAELKRCAGTQFDPELVEVFLTLSSHS